MSIEQALREACRGLPGVNILDENHLGKYEVRFFAVWDIGWMSGDSKVHLTDILPSLMPLWAYLRIWVLERQSPQFE